MLKKMKKINISAMAKRAEEKTGDSWLMYVDTYSQIKKDVLSTMDNKGYDLIQIADKNNCHVKFTWQQRRI